MTDDYAGDDLTPQANAGVAMITADQPMRDKRGTIILCDYLQPMGNGKWIIAGTFTHVTLMPGQQVVDLLPLNVYLRFQVEQAGTYECELLLIHRSLPSNASALSRHHFSVTLVDPLVPCEIGCQLPPFRVQCPKIPGIASNEAIGVPLLLWLKVDGADLATCPLNVIFPPSGNTTHDADTPNRPHSGTDR